MKRYLIATTVATCASALLVAAAIAADAPTTTAQLDKDACAAKGACHKRPNLSDSQIQQLRALRDKYSVDTATKKAQLKVLHHQVMEQLGQASIDKSSVLATQDKINALRTDLSNARLSMMLEASNVFTPEQRAQMKNRMMRGGFRHHGGHNGFRGKGGHFRGGKFGATGAGPSAPLGSAPAITPDASTTEG
jgi:Spy/CpxP family protein refolding chaperone